MSEKPSENLPVTASSSNAPSKFKKKFRGKSSSNKRADNFISNKNDAFCRARRDALEKELQPNLLAAFQAYSQQAQTGTSVKKVTPCTTRGIGFHTLQFHKEAELNVPRIELPLRATVHQLYRVSLVQLARHNLLAEVGPTHSQALRPVPKPRIAAFGFHQNSIFVADAINSIGNFTSNGLEHITVLNELAISMDVMRMQSDNLVEYSATSPPRSTTPDGDPNTAPKQIRVSYSMPDPYTLSIYNLRDAVDALSNHMIPVELRNEFISRNPIPGAIFNNGLLTNPSDIMPCEFNIYMRNHFQRDVDDCQAMFRQVAPICPASIGHVAMDGKGTELSLSTVMTPPSELFYIDNENVYNDSESWMFATQQLGEMTRLRSYVCLMNEAPTLKTRPSLTSRYGIRDPNNACHSMNEVWSHLAWNVSPFQIHHG